MNKPKTLKKEAKFRKDKNLIDPYTGEVEDPAEDAYKVDELVPVDSGERE